MNSIMKHEIQSDVRDIIAEIDYEEYMFNKIFKTHVIFKNSFKKFNIIYNVYGPQAYRRYVPTNYQKQDLVNLINAKDFLLVYDRHGKRVFNNLAYTITLRNFKKYYGRARAFFYKLSHLFTRHKLKLGGDALLMLPETVPTIEK